MKTNLFLGATLISALAFGTSLQAQQADTLRRSLVVLTSEETVLGERAPQPMSLLPPAVYRAKPTSSTPPPLAGRSDLIQLYPTGSAPELLDLGIRSRQMGYVDASLGLRYNGHLSAGFRPVNTAKDRLDLGLSGRFTRYTFTQEGVDNTIREHQLGASVGYTHEAARSRWGLGASYDHTATGFYGIAVYSPEVVSARSEREVSSDRLDLHDVYLSGLWETKLSGDSPWRGSVKPSLRVVQGRFAPVDTKLIRRELIPSIEASLGWARTEQLGLGLDASLALYRITLDGEPLSRLPYGTAPEQEQHRSVIRLAPHLEGLLAGESLVWGYRAGFGFHAYRQASTSGVLLTPDVSTYLSWREQWRADLSLSGGINANDLHSLSRNMPYLLIDQPTQMTRTPLRADFKLSGRILSQLTMELSARYERMINAVNYRPIGYKGYIPTDWMPIPSGDLLRFPGYASIGFAPDHVDANVFSFGGNLSYRHAGLWGAKVNLRHTVLPDNLWGRPTTELSLDWQLRPDADWTVSIGYDLMAGIRYTPWAHRLEVSRSYAGELVELKALQTLRLAGAYSITKALSLRADGQLSLYSESQRYLGYQPQRITLNVGVGYTF